MTMSGIQFQPELSMGNFMKLHGTEQQYEHALIGWRWPKGNLGVAGRGSGYISFRLLCIGAGATPMNRASIRAAEVGR